MKKVFITFIIFFSFVCSYSQVGIGTTTPNTSSALDITDSAKGLLIPRMTMVKRNAIANPATGLVVYQTDSTKGFWYYDGAIWKNINASSSNNNYGGKPIIILSDSITNAQAAAKLAAEVGPNTQQLRIEGCLNLTVVDLSMFTSLANITITDNPVLVSVNLSNLKTCEGYFSINNCRSLSILNVNSLEKLIQAKDIDIITLYISNTGLTTVNFPKLNRILGTMEFSRNGFMTSIAFPVLTGDLDALLLEANGPLQSVSFPFLQSVGIIQTFTNPSLTTLSFPGLTKFTFNNQVNPSYETWLVGSPNLSSIILGNLTQFINYGFNMDRGKLPSSNVNDLLHKFVSITPPITGKEFILRQTPAAPPTGQGLLDKAQLIAQGNSVQTD